MSEHIRLVCSLTGYEGNILSLGWSPSGRRLAASCTDGTVRLWDIKKAAERFPVKRLSRRPITDIDWSSDAHLLACSCQNGSLILCDPLTLTPHHIAQVSNASLNCVAWAPRGHLLATAGDDHLLHVLDFRKGAHNRQQHQRGEGHQSPVRRVLWSGDTTTIFTATDRGVVGVWREGVDNQLRAFLQSPECRWSHADQIWDLAYSQASGRLVSASQDRTVKVWDVEKLRLDQKIDLGEPALGVCFSPGGDVLIIRTLERVVFMRSDRMEEVESFSHPAPVGAGYLAINDRSDDIRAGLIATEDEMRHCIDVWEVDFAGLLKRASISRRTYSNAKVVICGARGCGKTSLLLALASQPFDQSAVTRGVATDVLRLPETSNEDGSSDVKEIALWDFPGDTYEIALPIYAKAGFLALSVVDATVLVNQTESLDSVGISRHPQGLGSHERQLTAVTKSDLVMRAEALSSAVAVLSSRHPIVDVTSAKTGDGIKELLLAVADSVQWARQPTLQSIDDFVELRNFVEEQRSAGNLLVSEKGLYTSFIQWAGRSECSALRTEFATGIQLLENLGNVYRFGFGNQILLEPSYVETYVSAFSAAAARDAKGMGRIPSVEAYLGRGEQMIMPNESRISREFERTLLSAVLEELQERQLIVAVAADGINYIVFPTQPTRIMDELPPNESIAATASFDGEGGEIYSSLVVRSLRLPFSKKQADLYRNAAVFKSKKDATCGVVFRPGGEQRAELSVFFDSTTDANTREDFLEFVRAHLAERTPTSLRWNITQSAMDAAITPGLGVFFSYDRADLPNVLEIAAELKRRGAVPWLEEFEIQPGDSQQKRIDAITKHHVAIIAISGARLSLARQGDCAAFKRHRCRIIPVILPGTPADLDIPPALKDYAAVDFRLLGQRQYERLIDGIRAGPMTGMATAVEIAHAAYEYIMVFGAPIRTPMLSEREFLAVLQHASQDPSLQIKDSPSGSVYLFAGAEAGYRKLESLWISGKLSELLGRPVHRLHVGDAEVGCSNAMAFEPNRMVQQACTMFVSYSRKDIRYLERFRAHLSVLQRQGLIRTWHDRDINAGDDWQRQIDLNLAEADFVLLLVSPDFLASEYCYGVELKLALQRHRRHEAHVIPVIVRQADWQPILGEVQALPRNAKPIVRWDDRDSAWHSVVQEIRRIAGSVISSRSA